MGREERIGGGTLSRRELIGRGAALGLTVGAGASSGVLAGCMGDDDDDAPTRGGLLRVAVVGGGASTDTLEPSGEGSPELGIAFRKNVYSKLTDINAEGAYENVLAESMEPNDGADVWQVKLKSGVEFHDGSTLTADDVIYSLQRMLDPANKLTLAAPPIEMIERDGLKKVDATTLTIRLNRPYAHLDAALGQRFIQIVKEGAKPPFEVRNSVGTGPFKITEWVPGRRYAYEAHRNYFESGKPRLDRLVMTGIPDPVARINALVAGQVDAIADVPPAQVRLLKQRGLGVLVAKGGRWTPLYMNTQMAPFDDVRVRQAMKHLMDRPQALDSALSGYGILANDVFGRWDPLYDSDLPKRAFDPERAQALLRQAGQQDTEFVLHTSKVVADFVPNALVFQQGAKEAGVKVTLQEGPADSYWAEKYGKVAFAFADWGYRPFLAQWDQCFKAWNSAETDWADATAKRATKLVDEAAATTDQGRATELCHEAQRLLWEEGAYVIPYFRSTIDGYSKKVRGLKPHIFTYLGWYAFENVWLT
jgi:peptide/nickel transport system substrate-binding protein